MPDHPRKLSPHFSGVLRTFAYWIANGSVGVQMADGDYRHVMLDEPSLMEMAFAIFANVIEFDADGQPTNAKYAEHRAAQYIKSYCESDYTIEPPLEDWEVTLYPPPSLKDSKPWPDAPAS